MKINILHIIMAVLIASCSRDSNYERWADLSWFNVIAVDNGTLSVKTEVSTNIKLIEYALFNEKYDTVYNFLDKVRNKNNALKETDGGFTICFKDSVTNIPIDVYILSIITVDGIRISKIVGEKFCIETSDGKFTFDNNISDKVLSVTPDGKVTGEVRILSSDGKIVNVAEKGIVITKNYIAAFEVSKSINYCISGTIIRNGGYNDFSNIKD